MARPDSYETILAGTCKINNKKIELTGTANPLFLLKAH